jgi:peptidoglycan/LPS O-acetylase OafA/YrhL
MLELITGITLAASAGLNAYIPLLGLGLLSRFTDIVQLPSGWAWLENGWSLGVLGVLLVVEVLVDKFPVLDTANDVLQTVVRPASGGMVFAAGSSSETVAVADPAAFVTSAEFWPFVLGVLVALVPHLLKTIARPVLNALTGGAGAAVSSFIEDIGALVLTLLAVVVPVLALVLLIVVVVVLVRRLRRAQLRRREQRAAAGETSPPV